MHWFSLVPRWRTAVLLALVAGFALGHLTPPSAPPTARAAPSPDEEATPDSLAPSAPYAAVAQRQQSLGRLGANRWHSAGFRGQGVKVAVLDSGFRGYRAFLGRNLPARVTARSFRDDGNLEARDSQHGILCAEVIHALAPGAELLLANWEPDRPERFLAAVRWAKEQGAQVISCSLIMPSWSDGEGGGPAHEALASLLGAGDRRGDVLCFASAGNTAQRHWHGPFNPDRTGHHQWRKGQADNILTPWGNERVSVEVYGPRAAGYEILVHEAATGRLVGRSSDREQKRAHCALVRFTPVPQEKYRVRVRCEGAVGPFHLVVLGGGLSCTTSKGSIPYPADGRHVQAVGAVDPTGRRYHYSSCGPNSPLPKPDFVAEVPFPSLWRDRPFAGTSAAAPQAAGLAALWWSRHPGWTCWQVTAAMRAAAVDLGPPGHDWETGYGRLTLP
jgi:subtilisin family serine protease